ncbi:NADPH-dependent FMN reductase [Vibrio methylphosphonaticus]|uniref:NADPH-dependent FMN reductase n=1 Tax=Vibrio methylphosphonaticus TaxID=2946866 RepID=UPI00202AADF0|nr:NAD(P)H-dependent oxidoreductase [Vibrio methylphosphonaticus]MCL9776822.1 NAD(P)H-dependent oxidoreductase [Vibrio methylphosphonaticus]
MKVLAFGASNSRTSINQVLANYAANLIEGAQVDLIDLNDFEAALYSEDREKQSGIPEQAQHFYRLIGESDAIVISFAEHNGSYTAAYKNLFDWTSRINMQVFQNKPVVYLATSPGPGGAQSVLASATHSAPYFAAEVKGSVSVPNFYDNFDMEQQVVTDGELQDKIASAIAHLC